MNSYEVLKMLCNFLFLFGGGDMWYENNGRDNTLYAFYSFVVFLILDIFTVLEILVVVFGGFPQNFVNEATMFGVTHFLMGIKRYTVKYSKNKVKILNRAMVKACLIHENDDLYKIQYKKLRINIFLSITTVYITISMYAYRGFLRIIAGETFMTVTTYWPSYDDLSLTAGIARGVNVFILCFMLAVMIPADGIIMSHLIILAHKFKTLKRFFEQLKEDFEKNSDLTNEVRAKKLRDGCLEGVLMHQDLLKLFEQIQEGFGPSMSIQVILCSGSAVLVLMQFALAKDLQIASIITASLFVVVLLVMLAIILWNAGDMTYEASLLPEAIFQCGWNLSPVQQPSHKDVRQLVLLACAESQRPLIVKAFGVSNLSYVTFVTIMRTTYSVFAVLYNGTD